MSVYTDPVFPLPEPGFLWVHDLLIRGQSGASVVTDTDGRWRYADLPDRPVRGYLTAPSPRDVTRAAALGVEVDAVALVPNATDVSEVDVLDSTGDPHVPTVLRGVYSIGAPRPNPSHTRLLLSRVKGEPTPPHAA